MLTLVCKDQTKNYKDLENAVWTIFKSMTFAFTVILKSVAVDVPDGQGLILVPNAAQDIISIYANFNFITEHLGEGAGKQAYQETLTNAVAYLIHEDNQCQLNRLLSLAFKEYGKAKNRQDLLQNKLLITLCCSSLCLHVRQNSSSRATVACETISLDVLL